MPICKGDGPAKVPTIAQYLHRVAGAMPIVAESEAAKASRLLLGPADEALRRQRDSGTRARPPLAEASRSRSDSIRVYGALYTGSPEVLSKACCRSATVGRGTPNPTL